MFQETMNPLTVVILSYNSCLLLQRCVRTLLEQKLLPEQIVIVDNASHDGSVEWLSGQTSTGLRIHLLEDNRGFAAGNNVGIAHATSQYVLLLNTDAYPKVGSLEALVAYMDAHPRAAIVGPQLIFEDGRWQRGASAVPSPRQAMLEALGLPSLARLLRSSTWPLFKGIARPRRVGYIDGACMLIRRSVLDEIGPLDTGYFFYAEDADICDRARRAGYGVVLVPSACVIHLRGGSSARKDRATAERMKRVALRRFVTQRHGETGWQRYSQWTARNFRWRARLCRMAVSLGLAQHARCSQYAENAHVYTDNT